MRLSKVKKIAKEIIADADNEIVEAYTPSQHFRQPVIGTITTKSEMFPEEKKYDVIIDAGKHYVCNQWYKYYKKAPQLVPKQFVIKFEKAQHEIIK